MAKNVKINNVTYDSVPSVDIPKADGSGVTILGVAGGLSAATVAQDSSTKVLRIS